MGSIADAEGPGRPLSVKEISERAQAFEWNVNIPFKHWMRTAQTLQQEADIYLCDGNFPQAYLLYLRYSTLILDLLKTHPESKTPEAKKALKTKYFTIDVVINHLEKIKPMLERRYEDWRATQEIIDNRTHHLPASPDKVKISATYRQHASKDPALSYASRLLDAGENQDLAVELARKEIQRRDAGRRATKRNGEARHQSERRTAGFWDTWTQDIAHKQADEEEVFRNQMESTRKALDRDTDLPLDRPGGTTGHLSKTPAVVSYSYPKIARSLPVEYSPQHPKDNGLLPPGPLRPPKEKVERTSPLAPERPAKTPYAGQPPSRTYPVPRDSHELPSRPPKIHESAPERPKKQQTVAFKPAAYLENGEPIRPIFLPRQLRRRFLEIASENTKRGLEMCGILCGTAVNNALFVRCLLIPEQICTSDTCETENEASMLDYCIEEDLLMLGWIHTHPTQTCFMSSRDLHTQSGYQVMLPESIAIVCAPKFDPSYGIFRLTNPPGLSHILNCTQSSTFHPHSVDNLYTGAEHPPGHVYEHDNLEFYVQDIRPGARNGAAPNKKC
ncbi:putative Mov34 MPN PAD-1 family protein [Rosellinia necatrix]|uniref:Putative Mov34 MPN PAD-1 family protein n=1 Tax=Rosellinia necatrix TaxID=77044 RepID=A0A1W2TVF4_ROSNE|nr:putative Mov34 MPN PAD-1 family protein [Rosellinia necatrix]